MARKTQESCDPTNNNRESAYYDAFSRFASYYNLSKRLFSVELCTITSSDTQASQHNNTFPLWVECGKKMFPVNAVT